MCRAMGVHVGANVHIYIILKPNYSGVPSLGCHRATRHIGADEAEIAVHCLPGLLCTTYFHVHVTPCNT